MLEITGLTLRATGPEKGEYALRDLNARFKPGSACALIAPPGSGATALLETLAGLRTPDLGAITLSQKPSAPARPLLPGQVAWLPESPPLDPALSPRAHVARAAALLGLAGGRKRERVEGVLAELGFGETAGRALKKSRAGSLRRAGLACLLLSKPHILLADRFLEALAPDEEAPALRAIRSLASEQRCVIVRLDAPRHLARFDTALVLHQGHVAFHGAPEFLCHYFSIERPDDLFSRLAERSADDWHRSWLKHGTPYLQEDPDAGGRMPPAATAEGEGTAMTALFFRKPEPPPEPAGAAPDEEPPAQDARDTSPGWPAQAAMAFSDRLASALLAPRGWLALAGCLAALLAAAIYPMLGAGGGARAPLLVGFAALLAALAGVFGAVCGASESGASRARLRWERRLGWKAEGRLAGLALFALGLSASAGLLLFAAAAALIPGLLPALPKLASTGALAGAAAGALGLLAGALFPCRGLAMMAAPLAFLLQLPLAGALLAPPPWGELILRPVAGAYWAWLGGCAAFADLAGLASPAEMKMAVPELVATSWAWSCVFLAAHAAAGIALAIAARKAREVR